MAFTISSVQVRQGTPASVLFDVAGSPGITDQVVVEFEIQGVRRAITPAAGATNPMPVVGASGGQSYDIPWDTAADLGSPRASATVFVSLISDPSVTGSMQYPAPPRIDHLVLSGGAPPSVRFILAHDGSAACALEVQWASSAGAWQPATPAGPVPGPSASSPRGEPASFAWSAAQDLGAPPPNTFDVRVRASTAGDAGEWATLTALRYAALTNPAPSVVFADHVADPLSTSIRFMIADPQSQPCSVEFEFLEDRTPPPMTRAWRPLLPLAGVQPVTVASSPFGTQHLFAWDTRTQFTGPAYPKVFVRLTARDLQQGGTTFMLPYSFVPNSRVTAWDVDPDPANPFRIRYRLVDTESDPCSVEAFFSIDDAQTWRRATAVSGTPTSGLASSPGGVNHMFEWDAKTDLGTIAHPMTIFRIVPNDVAPGVEGVSRPFIVNFPPVCTILGVRSSDPVIVQFDLLDQERDVCSVVVKYSLNGTAWIAATEAKPAGAGRHLLSAPPNNRHVFAWDARADLGAVDVQGAQIGVTPADLEDGTMAVSQPFDLRLAPNTAPAVTMTAIAPGTYRAPTIVGVDLADAESDPLHIEVEYSIDGGNHWHPGSVRTPSLATPLATSASGVHYDLEWDSWADLGETRTTAVRVQVCARDARGRAVAISSAFDVDTRPPVPPAIMNAQVLLAGVQGPAVVSFDLVEPEGRDCVIDVMASRDSGASWTPATRSASAVLPPFDARPATAAGVRQFFAWDVLFDMGTAPSARIKLTPRTTRDGLAVELEVPRSSLPTSPIPPPLITNATASQAGPGEPVLVTFTVTDAACRPVQVAVDFVDAAGTARRASDLAGPTGLSLRGLVGEPDGAAAVFAWDAARDLQGTPGTFHVKLTPRTFGSAGVAVDTATLAVDASPIGPHAPAVIDAGVRPITRDGIVDLHFALQDPESNRCDVSVAWHSAALPAPQAATLRPPPSPLPSNPAGQPAMLQWDALSDLGPGVFTGVRLTVTASDGQASPPALTAAFDAHVLPAHPRGLTGTSVAVVSAERRQPVIVTLASDDPFSEYARAQLRFSLDGARDWRPATVAREWSMSANPPVVTRGLAWEAWRDLPAGDYPQIRVEATPVDGRSRPGRTVRSGPFALQVAPREALPPSASGLQVIPGATGEPVTLRIRVVDAEGLPCNLSTEYSTTGGVHWAPATIVDSSSVRRVAVTPQGTDVSWLWNVRADLADGHWPDVRVRVTAGNPWIGAAIVSSPIALDVGARQPVAPHVSGLAIQSIGNDELAFSVNLTHAHSTPAAVAIDVSTDNGATWQPASPARGVERFPPGGFETAPPPGIPLDWWWDLAADLGPGASIPDARLRVTATVEGLQAAAEISTGLLATTPLPTGAPQIAEDPLVDVTNPERVEISVVVADPMSAAADVSLSYSTDGGLTYAPIHGVSPIATTALAASVEGQEHILVWHTRRDLSAAAWPDVRVQAAAGTSSRSSSAFPIDLTGPAGTAPVLSGVGFEALAPGAFAIDFTIADDRSLACEVTLEFMCVEQPAWTPCTEAAPAGREPFRWRASAAGLSHRWVWPAQRDMGLGAWHNVHVKVTASDGGQRASADIALGDSIFSVAAPVTALTAIALEDRLDGVRRRMQCALVCDPPGDVALRYSLVTPAATRPATMIGAPDQAYAPGDGLPIAVYWDAAADVTPAMDDQPQTLRVEAVRGGTVVAVADLDARTEILTRGDTPGITVQVEDSTTGLVRAPVAVRVALRDPFATPLDAAIEFSRDAGATWREATPWPGRGAGREAIQTSNIVESGHFIWDIERDIPERYAKGVIVQARLVSHPLVPADVSLPFDIDLEAPDGHAPAVYVTGEDGAGPVVPLCLELYDPDSDLVEASIEFFSPLQGRWMPATPADGSDLVDAAPAQSVAAEYTFLWDAEADAVRIFPAGVPPIGSVELRATVRKARAASLASTQTLTMRIDASPYNPGLRDYPDIRPASLSITNGLPQTGVAGQELATPLTLKLVDTTGQPIADGEVQLFVATGSQVEADIVTSAMTDHNGEAVIQVRPAAWQSGQLTLQARVVGAPEVTLSSPVVIAVKPLKVLLPTPPTMPWVEGEYRTFGFEFGSDDPSAGFSIPYGRPVVLEIDASDGRRSRRQVRIGPGTFPPGYRASFYLEIVPQSAGTIQVTVFEPGALVPLFDQSFVVSAAPMVQRRVGESSYVNVQPALVPVSGDDTSEHADGARWPAAGREPWAWPGLTLQTPFRVKLLIDGRSDGPSPQPPPVPGGPGIVVDGPPPDPAFASACSGQGVTGEVISTGPLGGSTGTRTLKVQWSTFGGVLSRTPTPSATDTYYLEADICDGVYFTPRNHDGPWHVHAAVTASVLDPGRQYWTRSFTDSSGVRHIEIHREDALYVSLSWHFEVQQAPVLLCGLDAQTTERDRITAGEEGMLLARVSPSAGTSTRKLSIAAVQQNGWAAPTYTGPRQPPPFRKPEVDMVLQAGGKELRSDPFLFVRGEPEVITPFMLSFLRAAWVQATTLAEPFDTPTDPPLRERLLVGGRPSVQEAAAGTTPCVGWESSVALSDGELVYPASVLDIITAFEPLSLSRTWRGHLGWQRRPWMDDTIAHVRQWAGAFGPGWVGSFEPEMVPVPGGFRFMDGGGGLARIRGNEPASGMQGRVVTHTVIDDDHAPIHLVLADGDELRFHADGTLREMVDPRGHRTRFTYDERSRLTLINDPHDRDVVFTPQSGADAQRVATISDSTQREVSFWYQTAGTGIEGMLGHSYGPTADTAFGGLAQTFLESYRYEGSHAGTGGLLPYAQVRLKDLNRSGTTHVTVEHWPDGRVKTQTWDGAGITITPGPGPHRMMLVNFRDGTEHAVHFHGAGADAAAPIQTIEVVRATSSVRVANLRHNRLGRLVRAELPGGVVERWSYDDDTQRDVLRHGNLLAHEAVHVVPAAAAGTPPSIYTRITCWEYGDWRHPAAVTAVIPAESFARRLQRTWRTDWMHNQFGEVVRQMEPRARSTRVAEDGSLHGPSPLPYTIEHKLERPVTIVDYNDHGLITRFEAPDGVVTECSYYPLIGFHDGAPSPTGGGLIAEERQDTTDTANRRFWYLGQPVATRVTSWKYDPYGFLLETTDSRGCRHTIAHNALGFVLRTESGIPPPGMQGQPRVERTEYDSLWRGRRHIVEQPGGTAEQGGTELVTEIKEVDQSDRINSVSYTARTGDALITKVRRGREGQVDGVFRPGMSGTQPKEILSVTTRDERGLPGTTTLKAGRGGRAMPVSQTWDDHGAARSIRIRNSDLRTHTSGAFGSIAESKDPHLGLTLQTASGADGGDERWRVTADGRTGTRSRRHPAGVYGFGEVRRNRWGLVHRTHRGLAVRPAGAVPGRAPDPATDGLPGSGHNWVGSVAVDATERGTGRVTTETQYDIVGRETWFQDNRANTLQTTWSPGGVELRQRLGERNQLAWDTPLMPWRDERWRWQPGTHWTSEVHRTLDGRGDVTQETFHARTGSGTSRSFAVSREFDALGRVVSATDASGATTRYTYDVHGEVQTMTDANGVLDPTGTTNVDGNRTTWIRDGLGRVVRVRTDLVRGGINGPAAVPDGTIERRMSHTAEGRIKTVTDAAGFTATWHYNEYGQLESIETPSPASLGPGATVRHVLSYDDFGRASSTTLPSGARKTLTFLGSNQLEGMNITDGRTTGRIHYDYHPLGAVRMAALTWTRDEATPAGTERFRETRAVEHELDSDSRITAEVQHGVRRNLRTNATHRVEHRIERRYDGEGRRTGLTHSDGMRLRMDLDRTGRLLGVIRGDEEILVRYQLLGDEFVWSKQCGLVAEQRDVDAVGRLSSIEVSPAGRTLVRHTIAARDRCGRIKRWTRRGTVSGGHVNDSRTFTYDSAGRIVREEATFGTAGTRVVTRRYDGDGTVVFEERVDTPPGGAPRRRTKTHIRGGGGAIPESILTDNGVGRVRKTLYDLNGHVRADDRYAYEHDALGRLTMVSAHGSVGSTRYTYDSEGRLVACARLDASHQERYREEYVWDDWRLIEVWRDNRLCERYVYGQGLNEIVRAEINGAAYTPIYGPDNSVDGLVSATGAVVESYAYDLDGAMTVFDELRRPVARAPLFRFGFHGHLYDPATRLVYMRERWYSVELAQFLEVDPELPDRSWNRYACCNGDVINNWDPYGRVVWFVPLLVVMAIGFVAGAGLTLARQGAEMGDGTREFKIDWGQVLLGGVIGALAAPVLTIFPELAIPLIGLGLWSGAESLSEGHYRTAAVDILTSLMPFGLKNARAGMGGRGSYLNAGARAVGAKVRPSLYNPKLHAPRPLSERLAPLLPRTGRPEVVRYQPPGQPPRDVIVIRTAHGPGGLVGRNRQPFYKSSGQNSGRPGEWFPYDRHGGHKRMGRGWLNKTRYSGRDKNDPLYRYGRDRRLGMVYRGISLRLRQVAIPEGEVVTDPARMNALLGIMRSFKMADLHAVKPRRTIGWGDAAIEWSRGLAAAFPTPDVDPDGY
jgi:RHS repeat-associated protein